MAATTRPELSRMGTAIDRTPGLQFLVHGGPALRGHPVQDLAQFGLVGHGPLGQLAQVVRCRSASSSSRGRLASRTRPIEVG